MSEVQKQHQRSLSWSEEDANFSDTENTSEATTPQSTYKSHAQQAREKQYSRRIYQPSSSVTNWHEGDAGPKTSGSPLLLETMPGDIVPNEESEGRRLEGALSRADHAKTSNPPDMRSIEPPRPSTPVFGAKGISLGASRPSLSDTTKADI